MFIATAIVAILSWLYLLLMVAVPLVLIVCGLRRSRTRSEQADPLTFRVLRDLHTIRQRLDVAVFKLQVGRQADDARRRLNSELNKREWR